MESALDAYGRHRLLTFDRDPSTREPTVEVAHEALLEAWERLRGWIDEAREDVRMRRRLSDAAQDWERSGRDPSFLLDGLPTRPARIVGIEHKPRARPRGARVPHGEHDAARGRAGEGISAI